jgi:hypothetical protein
MKNICSLNFSNLKTTPRTKIRAHSKNRSFDYIRSVVSSQDDCPPTTLITTNRHLSPNPKKNQDLKSKIKQVSEITFSPPKQSLVQTEKDKHLEDHSYIHESFSPESQKSNKK